MCKTLHSTSFLRSFCWSHSAVYAVPRLFVTSHEWLQITKLYLGRTAISQELRDFSTARRREVGRFAGTNMNRTSTKWRLCEANIKLVDISTGNLRQFPCCNINAIHRRPFAWFSPAPTDYNILDHLTFRGPCILIYSYKKTNHVH